MSSSKQRLLAPLLLLVCRCASAPPPQVVTLPPPVTVVVVQPTPQPNSLTAAELSGGYESGWGQLFLRVEGAHVRGAYSHRDGSLEGRVEGGVVRGTWCQSSTPNGHVPQGSFEFRFARDAQGRVSIDGHWTYADAPEELHDDWDYTSTNTEDPALVARAANATCQGAAR